MKCNKLTIWNFAQNKPSLIVKDIVAKYPDVNPGFIYEVLLKRGYLLNSRVYGKLK